MNSTMGIREVRNMQTKFDPIEIDEDYYRRTYMEHGIELKKEEELKMEDYKLRMVKEYKELKDKYDKLHVMLVKYDAGKLDFTPTCPIDLLRKQANVMGQYLYILETRAVIENVDLNTEI